MRQLEKVGPTLWAFRLIQIIKFILNALVFIKKKVELFVKVQIKSSKI